MLLRDENALWGLIAAAFLARIALGDQQPWAPSQASYFTHARILNLYLLVFIVLVLWGRFCKQRHLFYPHKYKTRDPFKISILKEKK